MKRKIVGWTCGVAALLAAALAVGCGRDASGPEGGGPLGVPAARLAEGAVVRATVADAIEVPREGAVERRETGVSEVEAVVHRGRALDERSGALLAATAAAGAAQDLHYTDEAGHQHRLVIGGAPGGGPMASVRYERDGEVVAEAAYRWDARDGGYVLRERVLTLLKNGRVVLRQVRSAGAADVTPTASPSPTAGEAPPPRVLRMSADCSCLLEWAAYIGASATLIVAGEVYMIAPSPATAGALVAAVGAWDRSLTSLLACQANGALGK